MLDCAHAVACWRSCVPTAVRVTQDAQCLPSAETRRNIAIFEPSSRTAMYLPVLLSILLLLELQLKNRVRLACARAIDPVS